MTKKADLTPVTNTYDNTSVINSNLDRLNEKIANTISRDGSTPNNMQTSLDMDSNDLLNVGNLHLKGDLTVDGVGGFKEFIEAAGDAADDAEAAQAAAESARDDAITARDNSNDSANLAAAWAESPTEPDGPGTKSAKTWAGEAEAARDDIYNLSVTANTLSPGSLATVDYAAGLMEFGIPTGPSGPVGSTGPAGPIGPSGPQGIQGTQGDKGDTGDQGPRGLTGVKGDEGPQGIQGPKGDKGDKGDIGPQGIQGPKGDTGLTGAKGDKGDTGSAGTGINAKGSVATSSALPTSPTPAEGDAYYVVDVGHMFVWTGSWIDFGPIQGPKGDKGDTGDTGPQGIQGPKGDTGLTGAKGDKGDTGDQGPRGLTGVKGDEGPQGIQGPKGDKGDKGDIGPQGIQGPKGDTGLTGAKGDKGDTGDQGPQGLRGFTGDIGPKGDEGPQGIQGVAGPKGDQGDEGPQGIQGPQGIAGVNGEKGDKGDTGDQGPRGLTGVKGDEGPQGIQGPKGDKGDKGDIGPQGIQGPKGDEGPQGIQGPKGDKGDIGLTGPVASVVDTVETFSGNSSKVNYTLSVTPNSKNSLDVYISGVHQAPATFSLATNTLTFSTAPPIGVDNIVVKIKSGGTATASGVASLTGGNIDNAIMGGAPRFNTITNKSQVRDDLGLGSAAVAPLLGTVSHTGGIPTGAVIQRGRNVNGEYTRWADGTQECWSPVITTSAVTIPSGSCFVSGLETWTFPAAFAPGFPRVASGGAFNPVRWLSLDGPSTTSIGFRVQSSTSFGTNGQAQIRVIGRWF